MKIINAISGKGVHETVKKKGDFFENLFNFCVQYKIDALDRGEQTPIMDKLIFKNVRALVGGKLRVIFSGGAPLSSETHQFLRACLGCPLLQGYGLTETSACATLMHVEEHNTGRVGPPVQVEPKKDILEELATCFHLKQPLSVGYI